LVDQCEQKNLASKAASPFSVSLAKIPKLIIPSFNTSCALRTFIRALSPAKALHYIAALLHAHLVHRPEQAIIGVFDQAFKLRQQTGF